VAKKKRKRKPKKKKKPVPAAGVVDGRETSPPPPSSPIIEPPSPILSSPPPIVEALPPPPPTPEAKKKKTEKRQPVAHLPSLASSSTITSFASMSTVSLEQTRAQSAHSYLQSENLAEQKVKVKTRAEPSSLPPVEEQGSKGGFFSRFSRKKEAAPQAPEETTTKEKRNLGAWFKKMNRKSAGFLAQILGADKSTKKGGPPMKWDHFARVMIDMGFEVDASTAGSSVRFQPPDPTLRSISFHKRKYFFARILWIFRSPTLSFKIYSPF